MAIRMISPFLTLLTYSLRNISIDQEFHVDSGQQDWYEVLDFL